jgi:RNA polymerase sigma factor for flagellar operon FliA
MSRKTAANTSKLALVPTPDSTTNSKVHAQVALARHAKGANKSDPVIRSAGSPAPRSRGTASATVAEGVGATSPAANPAANPAVTSASSPASGSNTTKRARSGTARPLSAATARSKSAASTAIAPGSAATLDTCVEIAATKTLRQKSVEIVPRSISKVSGSAAAAARASHGSTLTPARNPSKIVPLSERPIDQVWREYRVSPTTEIRNFLIARHLDLVAYAAERLHKRLPSEVEINDLKSAGAFGLMDAVDGFDPDRGVKFETFCTQRIRGAMFDELRSMDWVPRLVRSRTAKVEKVRKSIEMETGARPTEDEVASRLNVSGDEFDKLHKDSRPISMVSLTRKCFETDSSKDVREIDVVEDGRQENPLQAVQKQDLQQLITKGLSRAERLIVILYYYEEMTMKEIGATLDLSESRVSQMHSSILARLKAQMQHRETVEE